MPSSSSTGRRRFAVLYDLGGKDAVPCGIAVERDDRVDVITYDATAPDWICDRRRVLQPDGDVIEIGPGHERYFNSVLEELILRFGIGYQGEYGDGRA